MTGMPSLADLLTLPNPSDAERVKTRERVQQLENMVFDAVAPFSGSRFVLDERLIAKSGIEVWGRSSESTLGNGINFYVPDASPESGMVIYRYAGGEPYLTIGTRDPKDSSTWNKMSMGGAVQNFTVDGVNILRNTTTRVIVFGLLGLGSGLSETTIATGEITVTKSFHSVDTQDDDATDDLDTINGGTAGDILVLQADNSARTVVVKDGTGNLDLAGDFSLDHGDDKIMLICTGTNWEEISRSNNA